MSERIEKTFHCPLEVAMHLVGGKWQCVILWHLRHGALRFSQLKRRLPGITPKMLTQTLRELEENDMLYRKIYPEIPPRVEYSLSKQGEEFIPVLRGMYTWAREYASSYDLTIDTSLQEHIIEEERRKARQVQ